MKKVILGLLSVLCFTIAKASTSGESSVKVVNRTEKKIGFGVGFGSPSPALFGLLVNYNINDKLRAGIGYGEIEMTTDITFGETISVKTAKATTYDVGAEYFFMDSNFAPVAGLHLTHVQFSGSGEMTIMNFDKTTTHLNANLGFDWQARNGFNFAMGYNISSLGSKYAHSYMNFGWFY